MFAEKKYLNLGCGKRYHSDWINMDITPQGPQVIQNDLSDGIPLPDESCDVVYHAAMLEHLRQPDAAAFLAECYRVMKPSGIIRVGVPDLENICRVYLSCLSRAVNEEDGAAHDYDWIMLELFDQIAREKSGGFMLEYLRQNPLPHEDFIYERIGEEGRELVKALQKQHGHSFSDLFYKIRKGLRYLPVLMKQHIQQILLSSDDQRAIEIGRFRLCGEAHQWMYDRYSLARLLKQAGFQDPQVQDAKTSRIPHWTDFNLDTLPDGAVIKPDLFFMEAIKPGRTIHE